LVSALFGVASTQAWAGTVRVGPGDTLTQIAAEYGTTVTALAAANGISDPNEVMAGTVLQLPATSGASVTSVTVSAGQTVSSIAQQYGITLESIVSANDLSDPNFIYAGEVLNLPAGVHTASSPAAAPQTVVLAPGETLSEVASRYGVTVTAMATANGIADPNLVDAGATLLVPAGAAASVAGPLPVTLLDYPTRLSYLQDFENAATTYGVPTSLLEAVCLWESGWQPTVVSVTGAVGMCQIEPSAATYVDTVLEPGAGFSVTTPAQNVDISAALLAHLLAGTGNTRALAVAAYYQGLTSVLTVGTYPSSEDYVTGILALTTTFAHIS
jgi:LysM repeat protein